MKDFLHQNENFIFAVHNKLCAVGNLMPLYQNILQDSYSKIMSCLRLVRILLIHTRILHVLTRILPIFELARMVQDSER